MKIYRYYKAEHGLAVLRDLEIRTSIPNTLNDPFELSPNIDAGQFTQAKIARLLRDDYHLSAIYEKEGKAKGFANKKTFKRWYLKDLANRVGRLLPKVGDNVERVRRNFADDFSNRWRIICASRIKDSILMWSHYAAEHTGIVIEFDTAAKPFVYMTDGLLLEVKYSDQKPDYVHYDRLEDFQRTMFSIACTKAKDWSYEQEIRIIVVPEVLRNRLFLKLEPACITAVYCGCRCSAVSVEAVRAAAMTADFAHTNCLRAVLSPSKYGFAFESL